MLDGGRVTQIKYLLTVVYTRVRGEVSRIGTGVAIY